MTRAILLILLLTSSFGYASLLSPELATQTIDRLLAKLPPGTCSLSDFDLCKLGQQIKEVHWETAQQFSPPESAGTRQSAYYLPALKKVVISPFLNESPQEEIPTLALHEALGALGYTDNNYQISVFLRAACDWNLTNPLGLEFVATVLRLLGPYIKVADGGTTSVGGGGDINALLMKYRVLKYFWDAKKPIYLSFVLWFLYIPAEPSYDVNEKSLRLEPGNGEYPLFTIILPVQTWKSGEPAREQIVAQAAEITMAAWQLNDDVEFVELDRCEGSVLSLAKNRPPVLEAIVPQLIASHKKTCGGK